MPHVIKVKPYQRRRPVPKNMQALLKRLGIEPSVEVKSHDRAYTPMMRRPKVKKVEKE